MTTMHPTISPFESSQAGHAAAPGAKSGLLHALRPALQWRLMLLWLLGLLLPALVASLPVWRMFGAAFDHTVGAAAYAHRLDLAAMTDLASLHPPAGRIDTIGLLAETLNAVAGDRVALRTVIDRPSSPP